MVAISLPLCDFRSLRNSDLRFGHLSPRQLGPLVFDPAMSVVLKSGGASPEVEKPPRASSKKIVPWRILGVLYSQNLPHHNLREVLREALDFLGVWSGCAPSALDCHFP